MWVAVPGANSYTFSVGCAVPNDLGSSADAKKEFFDAVLKAIQEKGYKTFSGKVAIIARVQRSSVREIEPDNIAKPLLDALHNWRRVNQYDVQAGPKRLLERDTSAYVASFTVEIQKGSNRVEYFIWEVGPAGW